MNNPTGKEKIVMQLLGGMGNQMFQYALGRHLSIKNNASLKLDTSVLLDWTKGRHAVNRNFDLDIFQLIPQIAEKRDIAGYNPQLMSKSEKVVFHVKKKMGLHTVYKEKSFDFDEDVLHVTGDQYLSGLWQSYKYFEAIEAVIRKDFEITAIMSEGAKDLLSKINGTNAVCINIRRTDYISIKQTADALGFIGMGYYDDALKLLLAKISNPYFFIFSDDISWCRDNLKIDDHPVYYVDHSYAGNKFSDYLRLMIACKHYIIPNSTFGWWAAWLNKAKEKLIIAPAGWMKDKAISVNDLIPSSWIRV